MMLLAGFYSRLKIVRYTTSWDAVMSIGSTRSKYNSKFYFASMGEYGLLN